MEERAKVVVIETVRRGRYKIRLRWSGWSEFETTFAFAHNKRLAHKIARELSRLHAACIEAR